MKSGDIPSACPVASAAPTRLSLIHAAPSEARTSVPTARVRLQVRAALRLGRVRHGEDLRVGPEHEHQVEAVGGQQHDRDAGVKRRRLLGGGAARKRLNVLGTIMLTVASSIMVA